VSSNDETTAATPQRIDLTQFEGKGISPLMVIPNTYTIAEDNNRIYEEDFSDDDENRYGWIVGHIDSHYETDDPEYGIVQSERQEAMAKLFAMAPDLLAELRRMYEREDFLMKAREIWLIEERRLEKQVEVSQKQALQSFVRTSDIEKALRQALRVIRDDLDEAIAQGNLPITSTDGIDATKIRNFANDASQ
jgi:hypothetical protein